MPENQHQNARSNDILIVDDKIPNLQLLSELLGREGYQVRPANNPQLAIDSALAQPPKLILLDVKMPEMDGFEVCRRLKQEEQTRDIPIIFVSALQDVQNRILGFEAGGVDFISKPFQETEVLARVRTHLSLRNMRLHLAEQVVERTADLVQVNNELRTSEARFRATFEQAAVGIAHVSTEGRFLRINQKFCDIVGYSIEEMLQLTIQEMTHPDDLDASIEHIRRLLDGEDGTYSMAKRYIHKNGGSVWVNLTVSLVRDGENQPGWFVGVIEDITDVRQVQIERDRILELSNDLICIAGMDGYFKYLNPAWEKTLGYKSEELLSRRFLDFVHPDDRAKTMSELELLSAGRQAIDFENRYIDNDGSIRHLSWMATPLPDEELIYAVARDTTERKKAEEELKQSKENLARAQEIAHIGSWQLDIVKNVLWWSDEAYRVFEVAGGTPMTYEKFITHVHPEEKTYVEDRWLAALNKEPYDIEHRIIVAGEVKWVREHAEVTFDEADNAVSAIGTVQDITDRKRAEQKIIDYQQRLKALASQLTIIEEKERRRLAADLHDQVCQSLALANIQLDLARKSTSESKLADKFNDISDTLLETLKNTKQLMFELSSPSMHEIGLSSAISEWLEVQIGNRHSLKTEVIDNIPDNRRKTLDPNVRAILFRNVRELLVNVVKHARANKVSVRLEDRNTNIRIIVEDDGIGFEPRAVIQAGSKIGGFGLFSIEELMADLSGSLRIVSEPGKGCTAILSAPFGVDDRQERD